MSDMTSKHQNGEDIRVNDFALATNYAKDYLRTYFMGEPTPDDQALLRFMVEQYRTMGGGNCCLLEVGCGPVVNHVLPVVEHVGSIHMCDLRTDNLEEVRRWRDREPDAHNWHRFTSFVLKEEGKNPTDDMIREREERLRSLITAIFQCDLKNAHPLGKPATYPAVACFFTTEQASSTVEEWREVFRNLCGLVAPGGRLFTCAVAGTDHYIVYNEEGRRVRFSVPCLQVEHFQHAIRDFGFSPTETIVKYQPLEGQEAEGVLGVILVSAKKLMG